MPYSETLLQKLIEEYGFDHQYSVKCLEANRHNHITATYHLINKKNMRMKGVDQLSKSFDESARRHSTKAKAEKKNLNLTLPLEEKVPLNKRSEDESVKKHGSVIASSQHSNDVSPDRYTINN